MRDPTESCRYSCLCSWRILQALPEPGDLQESPGLVDVDAPSTSAHDLRNLLLWARLMLAHRSRHIPRTNPLTIRLGLGLPLPTLRCQQGRTAKQRALGSPNTDEAKQSGATKQSKTRDRSPEAEDHFAFGPLLGALVRSALAGRCLSHTAAAQRQCESARSRSHMVRFSVYGVRCRGTDRTEFGGK